MDKLIKKQEKSAEVYLHGFVIFVGYALMIEDGVTNVHYAMRPFWPLTSPMFFRQRSFELVVEHVQEPRVEVGEVCRTESAGRYCMRGMKTRRAVQVMLTPILPVIQQFESCLDGIFETEPSL